MLTLPEVARDATPFYGDAQAFTMSVRDASDAPVYTAIPFFAGLKLNGVAG